MRTLSLLLLLAVVILTTATGTAVHYAGAQTAPAVSPALTRDSTGNSITLGELSLADQVGRVPLIVRVHLSRWDPPLAQYTVIHVIYGDCSDKTITIDLSNSPGNPAETAAGTIPGRDMILELRPFPNHSKAARGVKYVCLGFAYDAPPQSPLNEYEDQVVSVISDGSAFEPHPQPGDIFRERIASAELIVRAQFVQVAAGESKWMITRVLKGDTKLDTLILDDQFFRQRAQAIVAHTARRRSGPSTTEAAASASSQPAASQPAAALVDAETRRLIKDELAMPKEAILFIDQVQSKPDSIHGRLRFRAYEDDPKQKLDKLQKAIVQGDQSSNL